MSIRSENVVPLLLPLFFLPGWRSLKSVDVNVQGESWVVDSKQGTGKNLIPGDQVTLHYVLTELGGMEIANTVKTGLPYSFRLESRPDGTDKGNPIVQALGGMRNGGTRVVVLPGDRFTSASGGLVPKGSTVVLTLRVLASETEKWAKVESTNAGRIKRALEVSRASLYDGPARLKDPL